MRRRERIAPVERRSDRNAHVDVGSAGRSDLRRPDRRRLRPVRHDVGRQLSIIDTGRVPAGRSSWCLRLGDSRTVGDAHRTPWSESTLVRREGGALGRVL